MMKIQDLRLYPTHIFSEVKNDYKLYIEISNLIEPVETDPNVPSFEASNRRQNCLHFLFVENRDQLGADIATGRLSFAVAKAGVGNEQICSGRVLQMLAQLFENILDRFYKFADAVCFDEAIRTLRSKKFVKRC